MTWNWKSFFIHLKFTTDTTKINETQYLEEEQWKYNIINKWDKDLLLVFDFIISGIVSRSLPQNIAKFSTLERI